MFIVQALVEDEKIDGLLERLNEFREAWGAHRHLQALVLPVSRRL